MTHEPPTGPDPRDDALDPGLARLFRFATGDADALDARIDDDALAAALARARRPSPGPVRGPLRLTAIGAVLAVTALLAWRSGLDGLLVLVFVVAPALLVLGWHRQARVPGTSGRTRVRRTVEDWADQIERQGRALTGRAGELRHVLDRLRRLEERAAEERRLCADHGLADATAHVDDLRRSLGRAAAAASVVADRVAESAAQAQLFAEHCLRDPGGALAEHGRLPWTVDPRRIGAEVDELLRELSGCADQAADVPLLIATARREPDAAATARAAEIAEGVGTVRRQSLVLRRPLLAECRQLLVAFDILHAVLTDREIGRITSGTGPKLAATAAVTASTFPQPRARRAAVRRAFLQTLHAAEPAPPWRSIGSATAAALAEGFGRR